MNPWLLLGLAAAAGLALSAASSSPSTGDASGDAVEAAQRIFAGLAAEAQRQGQSLASRGFPTSPPYINGRLDDTTRAWVSATQQYMRTRGISAPTVSGTLDPNTRRFLGRHVIEEGFDMTGIDAARARQLLDALLAGTQAGNGLEGLGRF